MSNLQTHFGPWLVKMPLLLPPSFIPRANQAFWPIWAQTQYENMIGFEQLHEMHKRATPIKMMKYRLALQLYKIYNGGNENQDWIDLNFQQNFNERNIHVQINDVSNLRIGRNILMNRLNCINNKIDYSWMNKTIDSFKILCKLTFLAWGQFKMIC